ncbi:MAG: hypothetical protein FJ144_04205 [Deltaproteobacteria bacterium]|nr:hypothetical protein [Deltaproteobacteria bacterium]
MNERSQPDSTDAFLLSLEDPEFIRVGALLGLRARPASNHDTALVDSFLDSDFLFSGSRRAVLVTSVPNLPPQ